MVKRKIYVSWNVFGQMTEELISRVEQDGRRFNGVYGIPRGGLALAVRASHRLDLPILLHPDVDSVIFDDISDKGNTLQRHVPQYTKEERRRGCPGIACLFSTPWTTVVPDWYLDAKKDEGQWLVYPWEKSEEEARREDMIFYELGMLKSC
jgi:hypoxanthine phosphoribosyltransferase